MKIGESAQGEIPSDSATPHSARRIQATGLLAICAGFFLVILDASVVNVALPSLQHELRSSIEGLQWIVTSYTLVFASLLLSAGTLGDRFGHKRTFMAGFLIFTVASLLCSCASTLPILIGARILQGVGPALLVPCSLALIMHGFETPGERARAIGLWAASSGIGLAGGPVIGGLLISAFGWRSIFLLNIPIGLLALVLTARYVDETPSPEHPRLDISGQLLAILALATPTYALIEGSQQGWQLLPIIITLLVCVTASGCFLLVEQRQAHPMLPLSFFASPVFTTTTIVGLIINFGLYGLLFVLSLFFQEVYHYSAVLTGLTFLPLTVAVALTAFLSGRITARFGSRWPMMIGLLTACVGTFLLLPVGMGSGRSAFMIVGGLLTGFGFGMTVPAMTTTILLAVPKTQSGIASATLNASRQLGGTLGIALLGALLGTTAGSSMLSVGMQHALVLVAALFLVGSILVALFIKA